MKLIEPENFRCFEVRTKLLYIHDLCIEIERLWAERPRREQYLSALSQCLETLTHHPNQELYHLGRLLPLVCQDMTAKQFLAVSVPTRRLLEKTQGTDGIEISTGDRNQPTGATLPLTVILDNIRSAHNCGAIFRTCETLAIERIFCAGYTAVPSHPKLKKTAMGTDRLLAWQYQADTRDLITNLKNKNTAVYALETTNNADDLFAFKATFPMALVLGNEHFGLDASLIKQCHGTIKIPTFGRKNSLNVSSALAVVGYELRRQYQCTHNGNAAT